MRNKRINTQAAIEFVCHLCFGMILLYFVISKKYLNYVTPRIAPYICFAAVVFFLWAIVDARSMWKPVYRIRTLHCMIIIIPIVLMLMSHINSSTISNADSTGLYKGNGQKTSTGQNTIKGQDSSDQNMSLNSDYTNPTDSNTNQTINNNTNQAENNTNQPENDMSQLDSENPTVHNILDCTEEDSLAGILRTKDLYGQDEILHGCDRKSKSITVDKDEFLKWLDVLFKNMNDFKDWNLTITGSVYKDPQYFEANEFMPARLVMTCCIADLVPYGIVCNYDKASELKNDSWVTVTGTIFIGSYEGEDEPQLKVNSIEPAEKIPGYIYPY